jgi:prolyl oligopeptidase
MNYPPARIEDSWDELAGVRTPDPYRWLEDSESAEVQAFQRAQNELASSYVRSWPGFVRLRELVAERSTPRFGTVPRRAGEKWFRSVHLDDASQAAAMVADAPFGTGRVLYDPRREGDRPPYLSWLAPSPDGTLLALGLCSDGSEQNTIRLLDVATGEQRPAPAERLMDNWSGGVTWLPDGSGFYCTAIDGDAIDLAQRILFFDVTRAQSAEVVVPWSERADYRMVQMSTDGHRLVAYEGLTAPRPVAVAELDDPATPDWQPFVTTPDAVVHGHLTGEVYYAVTDLDAPRGRLVAIPLAHPDPADWVTLLPESEAVLVTVTAVGHELYVNELVDTYARVRVVDRSGAVRQEMPLPGRGVVAEQPFPYMNLVPAGDDATFVFAFSSLTASWGVYQHAPGAETLVELEPPQVRIDAVVEDHWATSEDGTRVPYHVVRPASVTSGPTLVYAYGGFNFPWVPQFPGPQAAFVAAGGIFVHAHLRGGGELGRAWWEGGRLRNKQNCYHDLYAVAEDLAAKGIAGSSELAVTGGSNGGLLCGVALTQRPELWRAVVPRVPFLDVVGACRENYGRMSVSNEFGDVDDPDEVRRLLRFSPYQCAVAQAYPSVFLDAGDTDPRCPPWHARKLGARLQAAQQGDAPVLVRVWENVGHGWATDFDVAVDQSTEWLAFVCRELGVQVT